MRSACLDNNEIDIRLGNTYGSLSVSSDGGNYYWSVYDDVHGSDWRPISKELYDLIIKEHGGDQ